MDYFVQCGTTAILNRNLSRLADELRGELLDTGYVLEPHIVGNPLTRRLTLTARVEAGTSPDAPSPTGCDRAGAGRCFARGRDRDVRCGRDGALAALRGGAAITSYVSARGQGEGRRIGEA